MSKKILVVEDDNIILLGMHELLKANGYEVLTAEDGQQGLVEALRSHPDLILLDFFMPLASGTEMLAELQKDEWGKKVPVIFLSNSTELNHDSVSFASNVKAIILKADESSTQLLAVIKQHI